MKPFSVALLLCVLSFCPFAKADDTPDDQYVRAYTLIQRAEQLQSKGRAADAATKFAEAQKDLRKIRDDFPEWNPKLIKYRLEYLTTKLSMPAVKPAGGSAAIEGPAGPIELKLKWDAGKRYVQRTEIQQNSEMSVPGQAQSQKVETSMGQDIAISALKEREGGGQEMELEFLGISVNMKMPGMGGISFDTKQSPDKDASNPLAGSLRKLVGARVKFLTDASGKVESVQGNNELLATMADPNSPGGADAVKSLLSEKSIKSMSSGDLGLPEKPVKVGDSWPTSSETSLGMLGGDLTVNLNYTFKGWSMHDNRKCAVLEFTGDIASKPAADAGGAAFDGGKVSGTTWFDPTAGVVVETVGNQDLKMKLTVQGQSISTKMHQVMGNKLVQIAEISKK